MNVVNNESRIETPSEVIAPVTARHSLAKVGRRRLIKMGASAVPIVATLSGQSALATNYCVTTSAWGSDQVSGSASQTARHLKRAQDNNQIVNAGFTISAWNTAANATVTQTACWLALKALKPGLNISVSGTTYQQNQRTFGDLVALDGTLFKLPVGISSSSKVVGGLNGTSDAIYFMVAQLNYAAGKTGNTCFSDTDWKAIVAGTYNPQSLGVWTLTKTVQYLKAYGIVVA